MIGSGWDNWPRGRPDTTSAEAEADRATVRWQERYARQRARQGKPEPVQRRQRPPRTGGPSR